MSVSDLAAIVLDNESKRQYGYALREKIKAARAARYKKRMETARGRKCMIPGCPVRPHSHGYCKRHYYAKMRARNR